MIEEQQVRFVAAADFTDECRVDVRMRRKHMDLSASQARQFARELMDAAEEADRASASAVRPVKPARFDLVGQVTAIAADIGATVIHPEPISPDCAVGKHPHNWQDTAWDEATDTEVLCVCPCHSEETAA